MHHTLKRKNYR